MRRSIDQRKTTNGNRSRRSRQSEKHKRLSAATNQDVNTILYHLNIIQTPRQHYMQNHIMNTSSHNHDIDTNILIWHILNDKARRHSAQNGSRGNQTRIWTSLLPSPGVNEERRGKQMRNFASNLFARGKQGLKRSASQDDDRQQTAAAVGFRNARAALYGT